MQNAPGVLRESLNVGAVVDRPDLPVSFDEINNLMGFPGLQMRQSVEVAPVRKIGYRCSRGTHSGGAGG